MAERDQAKPDVGGFRGPQVCALVGITYRQLDYWARTGLLRPSIAEATGSGTKRRYSYHDVLELKVIKQLLDAGISLQSARRAVECLRDGLGADLAVGQPRARRDRTRCWPAPTARSSTCWPAARGSSTSSRCRAWSTSWTPTSCASSAASRSRRRRRHPGRAGGDRPARAAGE